MVRGTWGASNWCTPQPIETHKSRLPVSIIKTSLFPLLGATPCETVSHPFLVHRLRSFGADLDGLYGAREPAKDSVRTREFKRGRGQDGPTSSKQAGNSFWVVLELTRKTRPKQLPRQPFSKAQCPWFRPSPEFRQITAW